MIFLVFSLSSWANTQPIIDMHRHAPLSSTSKNNEEPKATINELKNNEFKDWISWTLIIGAGLCGLINLIV